MIDVPFYADLIAVSLLDGPFPHVGRAIPLLLGTCAQESAFTYTRQVGGGPALGFLQIEPATEADLWASYLAFEPVLGDYIVTRCGQEGPHQEALEHDMVYGILLARTLYYWRDPDPLPAADDIEAQAAIWKQYYNTPAGAGTEHDYLESYQALVAPYYPSRSAQRGPWRV